MAAPILNGVTLAHPSSYSRDEILQGSVMEMASGLNVVDIVAPGLIGNLRTVFKLAWVNLTFAEYEKISDEYWTMIANQTVVFVSPEGDTVNVQSTKNIGVKVEAVKVAGTTLRYNVSCEFVEYS